MSKCERCVRLNAALEAERKRHHYAKEEIRSLRSSLKNSRLRTKQAEAYLADVCARSEDACRALHALQAESRTVEIKSTLVKAAQRRADNG